MRCHVGEDFQGPPHIYRGAQWPETIFRDAHNPCRVGESGCRLTSCWYLEAVILYSLSLLILLASPGIRSHYRVLFTK